MVKTKNTLFNLLHQKDQDEVIGITLKKRDTSTKKYALPFL